MGSTTINLPSNLFASGNGGNLEFPTTKFPDNIKRRATSDIYEYHARYGTVHNWEKYLLRTFIYNSGLKKGEVERRIILEDVDNGTFKEWEPRFLQKYGKTRWSRCNPENADTSL